jgi:hypothetical protein
MRTAISIAAPPHHLRWQAAFTIKAYQTLSPVIWHHAFVQLAFRRQPRWESQDA